MKRFFTAILAVALLGAVIDVPQISLVPATVELHAKYGQSVTQAFTLNDQTGQPLDFEMAARDVVVRQGKRRFYNAGELPHSIAATAIFSRREGHIDAESAQTVQVILTIPHGTTIRAVAIYFRNKRMMLPRGQVMLNASLGALETFILTDDIALRAGSIHVRPASASQNMRITQELTNTGAEPIVPQGVAAFIGSSGRLVAKIPFNESRLLPGERLAFVAEYPGTLPRASYRVVCTFQFEGKTWTTEGRYTER